MIQLSMDNHGIISRWEVLTETDAMKIVFGRVEKGVSVRVGDTIYSYEKHANFPIGYIAATRHGERLNCTPIPGWLNPEIVETVLGLQPQ